MPLICQTDRAGFSVWEWRTGANLIRIDPRIDSTQIKWLLDLSNGRPEDQMAKRLSDW